jgi:hypothetical protein
LEVEGGAHGAGDWVADVLCTGDGASVAFEIQFSYQSFDEYLERTQRYLAQKIGVVWLVSESRQSALIKKMFGSKLLTLGVDPFGELESLPIALLRKKENNEFMVLVRSAEKRIMVEIPIKEFSTGWIQARYRFENKGWFWH